MRSVCTLLAMIVSVFLSTINAQLVTNQFTNYTQGGPNSAAFTTNNFKCIGVGKGNLIWAGSQYGGLYKYNDTFNIWTKSDKLLDVFINDIKMDADSGIWVAQSGQTASGSVASNAAGGVNYFPVNSDLSMNFYSVTGTTTGANMLSRNAKSLYLDPSYGSANNRPPRPWVAMGTYRSASTTRRGGVDIGLNPYIPYFTNQPAGFSGSSNATPICESVGGSSQEVWVGTRQNGIGSKIFRYLPSGVFIDSFTHLNVPLLTNGFSAQAIYFDRFGNKWVGLKTGGLRILTPASGWMKMDAISYFIPNTTQVNFNAISGDEFGNVYIGTDNGMLEYQSQDYYPLSSPDYTPSYRHFTIADGLPSNSVTGFAYDKKNGKLLIATSGGISFMNRREPYIKGVVYDVFCIKDSIKSYPGLQKIPLSGSVRVTLLKNGLEEETTTPNAFGVFELKEANDIDNYTVEVKYTNADGKNIVHVYSNIKNHTLMDPILMPDSLIRQIKAFKSDMEKRNFPLKLGFTLEVKSDLFTVDGFNLTAYDIPTLPFFANPITADHKKMVDNLAAYYTSLATVYRHGGDATDLYTDGIANLLDAVEALGSFAEFAINLKKPGNADPLGQLYDDMGTLLVSSLKAFKNTVIFGLTKASSYISDPGKKATYDKCISIMSETVDIIAEMLENGNQAGLVKLVIDNLKKVVSQKVASSVYSKTFAGEHHAGFVFDRAMAANNLNSPLTYFETYDNLFNPVSSSLRKFSADTVLNRKGKIANAADAAKILDIASDAADAAKILAVIPGAQVCAAVCKVLSVATKATKVAVLFYAMDQGFTGYDEIVALSDLIGNKSGLERIETQQTKEPTAQLDGNADTLVIRKNTLNQAITELQTVFATAYNEPVFKTKYRQYNVADSMYVLELEKTMHQMWSAVSNANTQIPGFGTRLNRIVDSFVSRQGTLRQAMTLQNFSYFLADTKNTYTPGLDSLCVEMKLVNDSAVNGIAELSTSITTNNVPSFANLVQDGYSINHSRVPGTSGTITYTYKNYGSVPQTNVNFKIGQPTGGYTINGSDSFNVGTVQPGQSVQVSYNFTAPLADSVGHYTITVKANNGLYKNSEGLFYVIDPTLVYSIKDGNWNDPTTWSNNAVPVATNRVYVYHDVIANVNVTCKAVQLVQPGKITVQTGKLINLQQ
jgi:NPCBM-associated, NEW3 domain of alpha-galactosidase